MCYVALHLYGGFVLFVLTYVQSLMSNVKLLFTLWMINYSFGGFAHIEWNPFLYDLKLF